MAATIKMSGPIAFTSEANLHMDLADVTEVHAGCVELGCLQPLISKHTQ
jgi:hypothetical protein